MTQTMTIRDRQIAGIRDCNFTQEDFGNHRLLYLKAMCDQACVGSRDPRYACHHGPMWSGIWQRKAVA